MPQTAFIISPIPPGAPEVRRLKNGAGEAGRVSEALENFAGEHYTVIEEKDFYKNKLRLLRKNKMIESIDPKTTGKTPVKCSMCDREVNHYNTFLEPTNETVVVCWECLQREEKGFFAKRDFHRSSRSGTIPR